MENCEKLLAIYGATLQPNTKSFHSWSSAVIYRALQLHVQSLGKRDKHINQEVRRGRGSLIFSYLHTPTYQEFISYLWRTVSVPDSCSIYFPRKYYICHLKNGSHVASDLFAAENMFQTHNKSWHNISVLAALFIVISPKGLIRRLYAYQRIAAEQNLLEHMLINLFFKRGTIFGMQYTRRPHWFIESSLPSFVSWSLGSNL